MAKSQDSFNKKEREKKRQKKKKDKAERKERRKEGLEGVSTPEFMYVDENGNLTATPPDPNKKLKINEEDIEISIPKKGKSDPQDFIRTGIVKFFNDDKGYGFIIDQESKDSFFVHAAGLVDQIRDNDLVNFEVEKGPKGPVAVSVKLGS